MLTLRCFGEVAASDARGARITLRSRKHMGLLLYLVAHPGTVHMRETLADLLWDSRDRKARHSLSQALYDIRSSIGPVIAVDASTVRLVPKRVTYELDAFERAFEARDHETVIDLYRGEFAPGLLNMGADEFERWLDGERERCRVLVAMALKNVQQAAEERGDWDQTCLAALRLVRQNEFDEHAHSTLMRALCMKGDHASALAYYRALEKCGWVASAPTLTETAAWARDQLDAAPPVVRERREPPMSDRGSEFRQLSVAFRSSRAVPVRLVLAGERGLGREDVVRNFAGLVTSGGGLVRWLPPDIAEKREKLASELSRHPGKTRLIVISADVRDWAAIDDVMRTADLSGDMVVGFSNPEVARRAEAARLVDFVIPFDPLTTDVCAASLQATERGCSPPQAVESARLSGGNPALARAILRAWMRHGFSPATASDRESGGRLAYERSAEVRSLVGGQLETLSLAEVRLATTLALLTHPARAHAELVVAGHSSREALGGLRAKGWLHSETGQWTVSRPLAGAALAWNLRPGERTKVHLAAARTLENAGLGARAAAASEFVAAGESSRAFSVACEVAQEALRRGRSPVAGQAAALAFEHATAGTDRLRSGFLLSEAEFQRGRFRRAMGVLHQIAAVADTGNDLSRVQLALARADVATGDRLTAGLRRQNLAEARSQATDPALLRALTVQMAVLEATDTESRGTGNPGFERIRTHLRGIVREDADYAGVWCDAFRLLFHRVGGRSGLAEARLVLETHRHGLGRLGYEGLRAATAAEFWVAMRGARLHDALQLLEDTAETLNENRHESANLNNLGAVLLELGNFERALDELGRCRRMDEALETPPESRAYALLNQAQCFFFKGDYARCRDYMEPLLRRPGHTDQHPFGAQAWALNGLLAMTDDDQREVDVCLELLGDGSNGVGEDDLYLVTWFRAAAMGTRDRRETVADLIEAADHTAGIDRLSAEKLRVLAGTYSPPNGPGDQREACSFLRSAGASWFVRFAHNWLRA
ncbi:BTAD domain-containing putative transcriptional regulator [Candidatus Palauibacter irciniicola]|uniref:AfsR/SARP family transcriptional regulator n=1 Tax=Candidatus Palauibacter irciniicola TaxID=3056733 RepID=UPI003B0219D3